MYGEAILSTFVRSDYGYTVWIYKLAMKKGPPGCLMYFWDEKLPSYVGDPY